MPTTMHSVIPNPWCLVNLACGLALLPVALLPHLAAQWCAAKLTGARVYAVHVGRGRVVRAGPLNGLWVWWSWLPVGSTWYATFALEGRPRLRLWLRAASGPFVSLGLLGASVAAAGPLEGFSLAWSFAAANAVIAFVCLRPWEGESPLGHRSSEGLQLLTLPWLPDAGLRAWHAKELGHRALHCAGQEDQAATEQGLLQAREVLGEHPELVIALSSVSLERGELVRAEALLVSLLSAGLAPDRATLVHNNLAYTLLLRGDPALLPRSAASVRVARDLQGGEADWNVASTAAALMIRRGGLEAGLEAATQLVEHQTGRDRGELQCFIAEALARLGRVEEAHAALAEAERLPGQPSLLASTRRVLSAATPGVREPLTSPVTEEQTPAPPPREPPPLAPAPRAGPALEPEQRPPFAQRARGVLLLWSLASTAAAAVVVKGVVEPGQLFVHGLTFFLALPAGVVLHELGHWVMGSLVGAHSLLVTIGEGRLLWERRWGQTILRWHEWPFSGANAPWIGEGHWPRLRMWLSTLGGPLVNLLLAGASLWLGWYGVALANGLLAAVNLVPIRSSSQFASRAWNDGGQLMTIPFYSDAEVRLRRADSVAFLGGLESDCGNDVRAEHQFRKALAIAPQNRNARLDLGKRCLEKGELAEARALFEDLANEALTERMRQVVLALLSLVYLLQGGPLLEHAQARVEEALALDPRAPLSIGTWAAIQVRRGRAPEALAAFRVAFGELRGDSGVQHSWVRGALLCFQAEALASLGRPGQAQASLRAAEILCQSGTVCGPARAAIGGAPVWLGLDE